MIIHLWKVYHDLTPNHSTRPVEDSFKVYSRKGLEAKFPDMLTESSEALEQNAKGSSGERDIRRTESEPWQLPGWHTGSASSQRIQEFQCQFFGYTAWLGRCTIMTALSFTHEYRVRRSVKLRSSQ
eukprot:sb/3475576/